MCIAHRLIAGLSIAVLSVLCPASGFGQSSADTRGVTAIDILLDPDAIMVEHAQAANARLLVDNPKGFALDAAHAPHITVLQQFVRTDELDKVYAAVAKVSEEEQPNAWELKATGYYDIPTGKTGLAGIVVEPTADLLRLQQRYIDAISPYTANAGEGSDDAFVPKDGGGAMVAGLVDYVAGFVPKSSGENYNPHVTVGVGTRKYLDKLKAEPFKSFRFHAKSVSIYQLGDFGTAQKLLWTSGDAASNSADPLPSWNEGPSKQAIVTFVEKVTKEGSTEFVPVAERIAVFDNDGTLWAEQPMYFQFFFAMDRVKALAPQHPEWKDQEPFASVLKGDIKGALAGGEKALVELLMSTHTGMTTEEFERIVKDWIATAKHPTLNRPYTECVYQPMVELLAYLRANGFKTYIVSGGGIEFMRPWVEATYGIPPEQVIGSSGKTKFEMRDGKPVLVKLPELGSNDDKEGKPVNINLHIGRRPIAAFGNSDGDLQMLQWTAAGEGPRFCLYVHHTDADREWAYDRQSHIGRLDKGLDEANARGWTVVDMKRDWKQVFPN
jgi:phosphoglycolate phosphatase-like HAD superfamily hydrolase